VFLVFLLRGRLDGTALKRSGMSTVPSAEGIDGVGGGGGDGGWADIRLRRLAMLGPSVVGKSAVTIRFCENKFVAVHLPTIEDTYHASAELDGQRYACEVKDTAGQDELSLFAAQSSIGVHGYVLLYSVTDMASFEAIRTINLQLLSTLGTCGCWHDVWLVSWSVVHLLLFVVGLPAGSQCPAVLFGFASTLNTGCSSGPNATVGCWCVLFLC